MRPAGAAAGLVLVLGAGYALKWADAQVLAVALPALKAEFRLSDTVLGLLGGLPFAIFYSVLGLPLARLADRTSRRAVVASSLAAFSVATALGAAATTFQFLFATRVAVAVGEAGATPAAQSLIGDLVAPARRGLAYAAYAACANVGILVGFGAGGLIAARYGWRVAFVSLGLAGLPIALLTRLVLPAGRRCGHAPATTLSTALRRLAADRAFVHLVAGGSLASVAVFAALAWIPSFLARDHAMGAGESGVFLGLFSGVLGGIGTVLTGAAADRLARRWGEAGRPLFVAIACLVAFPSLLAFYLAPGVRLPWWLFILPALLGAAHAGPSAAAIRTLAPALDRALAFSVLLFVLNASATVLGPIATGVLSDLLRPLAGPASLRWALAATTLALPVAAFHFRRAAAYMPR